MLKSFPLFSAFAAYALLLFPAKSADLPLPDRAIPENPPLRPSVVTCGGERLLLGHVKHLVKVEYRNGKLNCQPAGWRLINYPLEQISGFPDAATAAKTLFGSDAPNVKNYFFHTPGNSPEPQIPERPEPLTNTPSPALRVGHKETFTTIGAALKQAKPGDTVAVAPGIYREKISIPEGVALEGVSDSKGNLPILSGDALLPPGSFQKTPEGFWRANTPGPRSGRLSCDGTVLREVGSLDELDENCFYLSRSGRHFARRAKPGETLSYHKITADENGMLEIGSLGNAIYYAKCWIYVPPKKRSGKVVWDPRNPEPITGRLDLGGKFRIARQTGSGDGSQVNRFRICVNGEYVPVLFLPGRPVPSLNYGKSERIENFVLNEGWNELFFEFDCCTLPEERKFKFGIPKGITGYYATADKPENFLEPPEAACNMKFVPELLVSDPLPTEMDRAIYVRLAGDVDPNERLMELGVHDFLVKLDAPRGALRGFELRGGTQFQQRAQLSVSAPGCLVEGCLFSSPEVRGISVNLGNFNQDDPPIVIRGNLIRDPGGIGIGASGRSEKLTAANQNSSAPGRGRMVVEYNTVTGNNRNGYNRYWESGSFKFFRLTGCVIRYNRFVGGFGPGLWMDWEHYGNRIEGNLAEKVNSFGIGIEASPGANLVCNNVILDTVPGEVWFRFGILAWSADRVWAVNNTVDGRDNPAPAWKNLTGTGGIYLSEGPLNRRTRWGETPKNGAAFNNLLSGNRPDLAGKFAAQGGNDGKPVELPPEMSVTQDFYGLPRTEPGCGAFRAQQDFNFEIELDNGKIIQK